MFDGMMLPSNGWRTTTPLTFCALNGLWIRTPSGSSSEKSPFRILSVGTECVTASTVSSWSFSYDPMKKVLPLKIGPESVALKRL